MSDSGISGFGQGIPKRCIVCKKFFTIALPKKIKGEDFKDTFAKAADRLQDCSDCKKKND